MKLAAARAIASVVSGRPQADVVRIRFDVAGFSWSASRRTAENLRIAGRRAAGVQFLERRVLP